VLTDDEKRTVLEAALDTAETCYDVKRAMDPKSPDVLAEDLLPVLKAAGYEIVDLKAAYQMVAEDMYRRGDTANTDGKPRMNVQSIYNAAAVIERESKLIRRKRA
jgi:hypothetical protein